MSNPVVDMQDLFARLLADRPVTNVEQGANVRQYERLSRQISCNNKRAYSAQYMQDYKKRKQQTEAGLAAVTASGSQTWPKSTGDKK